MPGTTRVAIWLVNALLALRLLTSFILPGMNAVETDFPNYYVAARAVLRHGGESRLYDPEWFDRERQAAGIHGQAALFNYFPPISALVMTPLAHLEPLAAKRVWTVIQLAALVGLMALLWRLSGLPLEIVVLTVLLGGDALGNNFLWGQFYIVLTLLLTAGACGHLRGGVSGALVATAGMIKIFPFAFLLPDFLSWRWRRIVAAVAATAALGVLSAGVLGAEVYATWIGEVLPVSIRGEVQDPYNVRWNTLQALLRRLFLWEPELNPNPAVEWPGLYYPLKSAVVVGILTVTALALYRRRAGGTSGPASLLDFGLLASAVSLITPSQSSYHQIMQAPGIAGLLAGTADPKLRTAALAAFAAICANQMGAFHNWDRGWENLIAFPRVWIMTGLWLVFLRAGRQETRWPRFSRTIVGTAVMAGMVWGWMDYGRYRTQTDSSTDVPSVAGSMQVRPFFENGTLRATQMTARGLVPAATRIESTNPHCTVFERGGTVIRTMDGNEKAVFERPDLIDIAVSANCNAIAFSQQGPLGIRIAEWTDSRKSIVVRIEGGGDHRYPAYGSDGRMAFSTNRRGNWDIAVLDPEASEPRFVTSSTANDWIPVFHPDGQSIYFSSDRFRGYRFSAIYQAAVR